MKNVIKIALIAAFCLTSLSSCFQAPEHVGYIGPNIYLKGADTMYVAVGSKVKSDVAWLDNSTQPCHFEIVGARKANEDGTFTHNDQFLQTFPTMAWITPYNYLTDKTVEQVLSKITDVQKLPIIINEVNGQLIALEATSEIEGLEDGDVYHIDVSMTNSKGTVLLEDYAIIKFKVGDAMNFYVEEITNGICCVGEDATTGTPTNNFPYYDEQNQTNGVNFTGWKTALENGDDTFEGKKGATLKMRDHLKKVSNEPATGIVFKFKFVDDNGNVFDPSKYTTYTDGTQSYIDHSTGREDSAEWMTLSFPITPWPVGNEALLSYMKGEVFFDYANFNYEQLKADAKDKSKTDSGEFRYNAKWDDAWLSYKSKSWYVRLRSKITFYEPGTYEMWVEVPYVTAPAQ